MGVVKANACGADARRTEVLYLHLKEMEASKGMIGTQIESKRSSAIDDQESFNLFNAVSAVKLKVSRMMRSFKSKEVVCVDDVIPTELRRLLMSELDAIADHPYKDFQPGSHGQVQNLVNPSMYPYIQGLSLLKSAGPISETRPGFTGQTSTCNGSLWTYQCLPSQFHVHAQGSVEIRSYINNLDRSSHGDLYRAIELLFAIFLPMFETALKKRLRSTELQVVVKAVNYVIPPSGRSYHGGWHVEGMKHEHIVASGMYYYSTSLWLKDQGLQFSRASPPPTIYSTRFRLLHETAEIMRLIRTSAREILRQGRISSPQVVLPDELMRYDGVNARRLRYRAAEPNPSDEFTVPTKENRLLVFSNNLQHKVCSLINTSPHDPGIRKTIMFFLIDPDKKIVSTRDVPEQQWDRVRLQQEAILREITRLPEEILSNIMSRAKSGLTMEEAQAHRLRFLQERTVDLDEDDEDDTPGMM